MQQLMMMQATKGPRSESDDSEEEALTQKDVKEYVSNLKVSYKTSFWCCLCIGRVLVLRVDRENSQTSDLKASSKAGHSNLNRWQRAPQRQAFESLIWHKAAVYSVNPHNILRFNDSNYGRQNWPELGRASEV